MSSLDLPALPRKRPTASKPGISIEAAPAPGPPVRVRRWHHHWRSKSGSIDLSLARRRDDWLLRVPGLADFVIAGDCRVVRVWPHVAVGAATLEHLLVDQILPRVLAGEDEFVLHAAAVEIDGRVALFIGESGRGKSTWSAFLQQYGHRILSDDCVLLRETGHGVGVLPTYPSLRLFPDVVARACPTLPVLGRFADYSDKLRLGLTRPAASEQAVEAGAIYLLATPSEPGTSPAIERLPPGQSCLELVRNAFQLDPTDVQRAARLLGRAAKMAQRVPAFALHFPRDLVALPEFVRRVVVQFATRAGWPSGTTSSRLPVARGRILQRSPR